MKKRAYTTVTAHKIIYMNVRDTFVMANPYLLQNEESEERSNNNNNKKNKDSKKQASYVNAKLRQLW